MMSASRLPVGVQTFEDIRKKGLQYVDKTKFLIPLVTSGYKSVFLSRPHRFGKSLFLSTLLAYFEGEKELFEGLAIAQEEERIAREQKREPWTPSPVLYFDFNAINYSHLLALEQVLDQQLKQWETIYGIEKGSPPPELRLVRLIETLFLQTKKQVVILIDEYDKPLLETIDQEELNEANRAQLKAFYEVIKQCDRYIRFAFLTGITKFSKLSLFSGLNNLRDITLSDEFASICGFTEEELTADFQPEIEALAEAQKTTVAKTRALLKKTYDGYCFAYEGEKVYNPFSLLNVFSDKRYNYYWFATATPSYLVNFLKHTSEFIPDLDNDIEIGIDDLQDFRYDGEGVISLLFQSGYLTIKKYLPKARLFQLGYPNEEVRYSFLKELLPMYTKISRASIEPTLWDAYKMFNNGDLSGIMQHVASLLAGILYGNIPNDERGRPLREQYYQSVLYAFFRLLGLHTQSEVIVATGRVDMVVRTPKHLYIFEFKVTKEGTAQDAIEQIKTLGYAKKFRSTKRPIHLVGVSFDEKTRNIGEWKEELVQG